MKPLFEGSSQVWKLNWLCCVEQALRKTTLFDVAKLWCVWRFNHKSSKSLGVFRAKKIQVNIILDVFHVSKFLSQGEITNEHKITI